MWDEKHSQGYSFDDQNETERNMLMWQKLEQKEEKELYVFIARNKDLKSGKVYWYIDSRALRHFTNNIHCYVDFVEDKS